MARHRATSRLTTVITTSNGLEVTRHSGSWRDLIKRGDNQNSQDASLATAEHATASGLCSLLYRLFRCRCRHHCRGHTGVGQRNGRVPLLLHQQQRRRFTRVKHRRRVSQTPGTHVQDPPRSVNNPTCPTKRPLPPWIRTHCVPGSFCNTAEVKERARHALQHRSRERIVQAVHGHTSRGATSEHLIAIHDRTRLRNGDNGPE